MSNYLRSGLAGWAVWARREGPPDAGAGADADEADAAACVRIRLYGWACLAEHTFLLLYLASGRRVKATGARWLDAAGDVALEVAPADRRRA
ncbi:hypothetical protein CDD83_5221 [Cordyceps sp. RAO-2017]|nr:hypothetical protein CDD83_5221 [Cordyceps sp. RAO-2017]